MRTSRFLALPLAFFAAATTTAIAQVISNTPPPEPAPDKPAETGPARLIPREVLFGNPVRSQARISPDGHQIAYLAPVEGVMNIFVGPADNLDAAKAVTSDTNRGIRSYSWAYTNQHILYVQDKDGDENWKVYSLDLTAGGPARDLTPFDEILGPDGQPIMLPSGDKMRPTAQLQEVSRKFPDEILIGLNNRDPRHHDIHRVNIKTGASTLVAQNEGYLGMVTDEDYNVRFAIKPNPDGSMAFLRAADDGSGFVALQDIPAEDVDNFSPLFFDSSGKILFIRDARGRDTAGLFAMDARTGAKQLLASKDNSDAGAMLVHPTENRIQAVEFNYDKPKWTLMGMELAKDFEYLKKLDHESVMLVTSRSLNDRYWTVAFIPDNASPSVYLYDRGPGDGVKTHKLLFKTQPSLDNYKLTKMHPVVIPARDGLELVSYLSLPAHTDPDGDGRPNSPVPLVLNVHGGPTARDGWGYNPEHQWLANRGYAVLSVNYRGSDGFGKKFIAAGNMEWAGKMHDDLIDAVKWAVDQKIADESKVAIYGGSYGGYATLVGLTFTPDTFCCGVDIVGPSNLETLLNSIPPYWASYLDVLTRKTGDHRTEEGRAFLKSRSPITFVDRIKKPLLIAQGKHDPRVKQAEADQIVQAMEEKKIPVTYVLYPDEGHGFARPQNRMSFYSVAEHFLAANLGGRTEPFGDDFKGSSITIPAGADLVPGLKEAAEGISN
jgi:dipeptidyl aminopeptidase/acylaminoacyl peptidase